MFYYVIYNSTLLNYSSKNKILIDDKPETIDNWNNAGGIGILYKNTPDTLKQLKKLGL